MMRFPGFSGGMVAVLALLATAFPADRAAAQADGGSYASRAELERALEASGQGSAGADQTRSYYDAARLRQRLGEGDFRPGDEIRMSVEGYPDLSQVFVVDPERNLNLPVIGAVSLRGVLRSELQPHLTESIGRFIRDPRVRAESTIRLVIMGGVINPGYHSVPSHAQLTDLLTTAGGTTRQARVTRMRVERDGYRILTGDQLHHAVIAGRSIDQLGLQAGDHLLIPEQSASRFRDVLAVVSTVSTVTYLIMRVTGRRR
jgi:protein involved in polysaccharide export with SLBB domain